MRRDGSPWLGRALAIGLFALVPAALTAWLHPFAPPLRLPEIPEIGVTAARRLSGAVWVDARSVEEYEQGRVPGAVSLPEGDWEAGIDAFLDRWEPGRPVIVYCSSRDCDASQAVARRLRRELGGEARIHVLRGGWESWLGE